MLSRYPDVKTGIQTLRQDYHQWQVPRPGGKGEQWPEERGEFSER